MVILFLANQDLMPVLSSAGLHSILVVKLSFKCLMISIPLIFRRFCITIYSPVLYFAHFVFEVLADL